MRIFHLIVLLAFAVGAFAGCGGGGGQNSPEGTSAGVAITIEWPQPDRLIPLAANSIKLDMTDGAGFASSQTVDRPPPPADTSTIRFDPVPVGTLTVTATAYPQAGGAGTPQATGSTTFISQAGQVVSVNLTMQSTIDHLEVTPASPQIHVGESVQLTATAKNTAGQIVLVAVGNITWSSASPAVATVDANGNVSGVGVGSASITATETESGKSATVTVTVPNTAPAASFTVSPTSGDVYTLFQFDASACTDPEDAAIVLQVRWDWEDDGTYDTNYSTTKTASHQYASAGTKTIRLEVKDTGGMTATATHSITVAPNTPPRASFTVSPTSGDVNTLFQFDASACSDDHDAASALQVRWDWEDDGTYDTGYSTTKTASHQYASAGAETIRLEVKDAGGLTDSSTSALVVKVIVTIQPQTATISIGKTQTFTATVAGTTNTAVTWSVQEGTAGGSITSAGVYTAPNTPGTYHVVATSVADPTVSATATVTVQSGSLEVIVN